MYGKLGVSLAAAVVLAACSGSNDSAENERPAQAARDSAPVPAAAAAGHGAHAATDSTRADSAGAGGMVGMDHSAMGGMDHSGAGGSGAAAGHAEHGARTAEAGHAGMQHGGGRTSGAAAPAAAAGHAGHGAPTDAATRKLLTLAGELVRDPVVQREIQRDSTLREAWSDPEVRQVVTGRP